jgi:nucleoside-diphosphate-sugar epimerase
MNIFISGATGYIGSKLAIRLAEAGHNVHAIYRSFPKTKVITHKNIKLFKGDILDAKSIVDAMKGCDQVYHVAAFAKVWEKDPSNIYRMNIEGAMNVVKAAIDERVKKIVVTSTAGVFGLQPKVWQMKNQFRISISLIMKNQKQFLKKFY